MSDKRRHARRRLLLWGLFALFLFAVKVGLWLWLTGFMTASPAPLTPPPAPIVETPAFADIARQIEGSVVFIESYSGDETPELVAAGVGFAVDGQGMIATNHHVVAPADRILVYFPCGLIVTAQMYRFDAALDVALLTTGVETCALPLGRRLQLEAGESVGFLSRDAGATRAVAGRVVTPNGYRNGQWMIHLDIPVQPGQSGSPLLAMDGRVVGMVSYYIVDQGVRSRSLAVGIDDVIKVMTDENR